MIPFFTCGQKGKYALFISLIAFFCVMHVAAMAQETAALNVSVSPAVPQPGETLTLNVSNENAAAEELYFYGFELIYDAERFSFEGISAGELMGENALQLADNIADNTIGGSVVRTSGSGSGTGSLASLEFRVLPQAGQGSASFSFSANDVRNTSGNEIPAEAPAPAEVFVQQGETFTVHYNNPQEWEEVFAYAFSSEGGDYIGFPGEAMTPPEEGSDWYSYEIPVSFNDAPMNRVIFSNNNGEQTENLERATDGWYDGVRWYDNEPDFNATREVTFSVNMSAQIADGRFNPGNDVVYLRGINQGWDEAAALPMEQSAEEQVYEFSIALEGPETQVEEYKYYRAPTDDFEAGTYELEGQPNRVLVYGPADEPQILDTVFFNDEAPEPEPDTRPVTFSVDMSVQIASGNFDPEEDLVSVAGTFNDWSTTAVPLEDNGSEIYEATVDITGAEGEAVEYKFYAAEAYEREEEGNRSFLLGPADDPQILDTVFFNDDEGDGLPETVLVWPGDTDNDGSVNEADVLPLGIYWNATGPARENASTDWLAQEAAVWNPLPATYADTDGSGTVNQTDLLAVGLNFGELHGSGTQNEATPLAEVNLPAISDADKILVTLRSSQSIMLQGSSFSARLAGLEDAAFSFQELQVGAWAGEWQEENTLIEFERNEALQFSAAAVHKGLTETVVTSQLFQFEIDAADTWTTSATLFIDRAAFVNAEGESVSFDEIEVDIEVVTGTGTAGGELPVATALHQNYPNPFNPTTNIAFDLQESSAVTLEVLNLLGQRVALLADRREMSAGSYTQSFDASRLPSGMYLIRMSAGEQHFTRKMMLVK